MVYVTLPNFSLSGIIVAGPDGVPGPGLLGTDHCMHELTSPSQNAVD